METNKTFTVGPVTENLLQALRALAAAKNFYFLSFLAPDGSGEQEALQEIEETNRVWDPVFDLIENDIKDTLRTWAVTDPGTNEI